MRCIEPGLNRARALKTGGEKRVDSLGLDSDRESICCHILNGSRQGIAIYSTWLILNNCFIINLLGKNIYA